MNFFAHVNPRLRSLRSLSLGLLMIKPRRGFALAEENYTLGSRTGINPVPADACNALIINVLSS